MAEICCGVVGGGEPEGTAIAAGICDATSRAARKRRIEIRRFSGVFFNAPGEIRKQKKKKIMCVTPPIMEVHDFPKDASIGAVTGKETACRSATELAATVSNDCPAYGVMSVCGCRRDMEDTVSVHPDIRRRSSRIKDVAVSCKERMHKIVGEEMDRLETSCPTSLEWKSLLERSFFRMDAEASSWRGGPDIPACRCEFQTLKYDHVGSTAVVSVIFNNHIVIANCGDSRAVLCRNGSPVPLSDDHKPDRPDELRRIEAAGGRVIYWDGARVLGVLAMSRAIGDNYLKPFVISKPEVTVTEREEGDECLILASDGLWDVVTNEMACQIVRMILRGSCSASPDGSASRLASRKACADAATLLTKLALARHSADNISVVVVDLRR